MATMRQPLSFDGVHNFLDTLFGDDLHAKRVKSLAGATLGAIQSASLAVGLIGQGLALARGRLTKHAVKQVDRLLSNQGIDVDALLGHWVPYVVGKRDSITVAMDWTEFDCYRLLPRPLPARAEDGFLKDLPKSKAVPPEDCS